MTTATLEHAAWQRPALREQVTRRRRDGRLEGVLHVDGLSTPRQALRLESQLQGTAGVHRLDLDRTAQRLRLSWDPARIDLPQLLDACAAAGCRARPLPSVALGGGRRDEAHRALNRLIVAGLFAMQAMMFALVLYIGQFDHVDKLTRELFRWLGFLAAAPVVLWAGQDFYRQALVELRHRRPGTETVVALAVGMIFVASGIAAVRGEGEIWFDSISMLVFVLLLGRYLELRARHRAGALGEAAADAMPVAARRRRADGTLEWVAVAELEPGDHIHVDEGGVVPVDGRLDSPRALLDEALLSGESGPRPRLRGEPLVAGSIVVDGPLDMLAEQTARRSSLAALGALARRVSRPLETGPADRAASRFAARVLLLALATALFWLWMDPVRAFDATVAVLVVACPCAFALAAPVVASRAGAVLGRHGIWLVRPERLDVLARANHALFDKTGTLTVPRLDQANIQSLAGDDPAQLLRLAAALAHESSHPLSRALAEAAADMDLPHARDVELVPGAGIRGRVEGRELRLGRAGFVSDQPVAAAWANEALLLADESGLLAAFPLLEQARAGAKAALVDLEAQGLGMEIVSGDADTRVQTLADELTVGHWQARMTPEQKLARLQARRQQGDVVLAVGDGSNDAPLLAAADVSVALVSGTELAQAQADLLLVDGVDGLPLARRIAARATQILQQNRRGALIYNLAAVPFAAAGFVPPWLAVIGMCTSSLCVVLNALRIREPVSRSVDADPAGRLPAA